MKDAITKAIVICLIIGGIIYLWTNVGPGKYKESNSRDESYMIISDAVLKHKTHVSIVSSADPIGDWQSLTEYVIARDAFKGSNLQGYKYTYVERDGKFYTNYKFTYGSGRIALFIADKKMNDMAKDLEGLSDYEKVKALHDYLVLQCEYTGGFPSIYDALFNGKTICVGYAGTFFRVLNKANVPVRYVVGVDHAWNLVEVDGQWYNIDVTWDDRGGNNVSYEYFLKTDKEFGHDSKGATAKHSLEPKGKSAEENFKLFRNHSAMFYYGPMVIVLVILLVILASLWANLGKRY